MPLPYAASLVDMEQMIQWGGAAAGVIRFTGGTNAGGGDTPEANDSVIGGTSQVVGRVVTISVTSGSFGGADAVGIVSVSPCTPPFGGIAGEYQVGETIAFGDGEAATVDRFKAGGGVVKGPLIIKAGHNEAGYAWGAKPGTPKGGGPSNIVKFGTVGVSRNTGFMCFNDVPIPKGATIVRAYIEGKAEDDYPQAGCGDNLPIRFVGNPIFGSRLPSTYAEIVDVKRTVAYVDAIISQAWTADTRYDLPDITAIVQEIVNNLVWSYMGRITISLHYNNTDTPANHFRKIWTYDEDNEINDAPWLYLYYKTG